MEIAILCPQESVDAFQKVVASRTLLWGLESRGVDWELHPPWKPPAALERFDAVLCWSYGWRRRPRFLAACLALEDECRRRRVPVINSVRGCDAPHSFFLERWRQQGVPCPRMQRFAQVAEIELDYPLILRRDGLHMGKSMSIVHSPAEAEAVMAAARDGDGAPASERPPVPDLAVEFVDTARRDGYYCKWRVHVVADRVLPGHFLRSRWPLVNFGEVVLDGVTCRLDEAFTSGEIEDAAPLLRAARALEMEIVALDYSRRPGGEIVFWEANRHPRTAGDYPLFWLGLRQGDVAHGQAVADLVVRRIEEHRRDGGAGG